MPSAVDGEASFTGVAAINNYIFALAPTIGVFVAVYSEPDGWSALRLMLPTLFETRIGGGLVNPPQTINDFAVALFAQVNAGQVTWSLAGVVSAAAPQPPDQDAGF